MPRGDGGGMTTGPGAEPVPTADPGSADEPRGMSLPNPDPACLVGMPMLWPSTVREVVEAGQAEVS